MGTPLQEIYDSFFIKVSDEDFTLKKSIVFQFFKTALAYSYKNTKHSLTYILTDEEEFIGSMDEILNSDEIELISLYMKKAYIEYLLKPLTRLKNRLGTKDFNKLPDKADEYKTYSIMKKDLNQEIEDFKQQFYSYTN